MAGSKLSLPFLFKLIVVRTALYLSINMLRHDYNHLLLNKAPTLKEIYTHKHQQQLLAERQEALATARLILEALDEGDLKQATAAIKKLAAFSKVAAKDKNLSALSVAIKKASDDVKDYTGGGIGALVRKGAGKLLKKMGGGEDENPILKSLTLLSSLETGLSQLPTIVENETEFDISQQKEAAETNTGTTGSPAAGAPPDKEGAKKPADGKEKKAGETFPENSIGGKAADDAARKRLAKTLLKAFVTPKGVWGKIASLFGKGSMPYFDNTSMQKFIKGLMTADIETVKELMSVSAGSVDSTKKAMTAAQDMARAQQSGGGEEGKAKPRPVQSPEGLAQALAAANAKAKGKDTGEAQATAQENPKKFTAALVDDLSKKSGVPPENVNKVLSALIKANKLKTTFKVVEEGVSREHSTLSASDVYRAQRLYLESGGSSRRWAQLLVEETNLSNGAIVKAAVGVGIQTEAEFNSEIEDLKKGRGKIAEKLSVTQRLIINERNNKGKGRKKGNPKAPDNAEALTKATREKEAAEKEATTAKAEAEKLARELKGDREKFDEFYKILARSMNIDPEEFYKNMKNNGIEKTISAAMAQNAGAVEKAKKEAGLETEPSKEGGKHEALAAELVKSLKDVEPKEITAVLDALPPYLMAESRRRRLVEARRVKFN